MNINPVNYELQNCRVCSRIIERCAFILKTFIYEGKAAAENIHVNVANAKLHLEKLAKEPEELKKRLSDEMKREMDTAVQGITKTNNNKFYLTCLSITCLTFSTS